MLNRVQAPCLGCTPEKGRSVDPNCHERCEKYLNYVKTNEEFKKHIRDEKYKVNLIYAGRKTKRKS